mmetsp:Transcript_12718/g.24855  ORF Transcript_12718/g.24855 Transcript_12718/m.24855 type:complete len:320 (+) Transcript_12718:140-1099(+)
MAEAGLTFEKEEIPASTRTTSLLGKMLEVPESTAAPKNTSALANALEPAGSDGLTDNSETKEQKIHMPEFEDGVFTYADNDAEFDNNLPFKFKVWLAAKNCINVEIAESSTVENVIAKIVDACGLAREEDKSLAGACRLFAAHSNGTLDEDCPRLDTTRPIHQYGLRNFCLRCKRSDDQERLEKIKPQRNSVLIGKKKKTFREDPKTKFFHAAEVGNLLLVKKLLSSGTVDVEAKGIDNWTALHYAARSGNYNIVLFLIRHNANLDAASKTGWTPLHLACYQGHYDTAEMLLQSGAKADVKTNVFDRSTISFAVKAVFS